MAGFCIFDDAAVQEAARQEILRRYYITAVNEKRIGGDGRQFEKMELLMQQANVTPSICPAVNAALLRSEATGAPAGAMLLPNGEVVTGKTSSLLGAAASLLLNALKKLAGIDQETDIISPAALEPICLLKTKHLRHRNPRLHSDEILIALSISSVHNSDAALALEQMDKLKQCDAHFSVILSAVDEKYYKRLGINVTSEPKFEVKL